METLKLTGERSCGLRATKTTAASRAITAGASPAI